MDTMHPRTKIGRTRLGGGSITLVMASLLVGALGAAAIAAFGALASTGDLFRGGDFWLACGIFFICTLPALSMLGWLVLVDRDTLSGAVDNPEESVETHWHNEAAKGAFQDTIFTLGMVTLVLSITRFDISGLHLGLGVLILMMFDYLIRFNVARRNG